MSLTVVVHISVVVRSVEGGDGCGAVSDTAALACVQVRDSVIPSNTCLCLMRST